MVQWVYLSVSNSAVLPGAENGAGFCVTAGRFVSRVCMLGARTDFDWLGILWRDPGSPWLITSRFRYYDAIDHERDRKVWACYQLCFPDEYVRAAFVLAAEGIQASFQAKGGGGELEVLMVDSDEPEVVLEALESCRWVQMRPVGAKS